MVRVVLAPTLELARQVEHPVLTVEAEYGSTVIEGSLYTAAHHQPAGSPYAGDHTVRGGRPSPCVDMEIPCVKEGVVLLSHIDLDSVGGVLRANAHAALLFEGPRARRFWALAAFVDVRGPHRVADWVSDETAALAAELAHETDAAHGYAPAALQERHDQAVRFDEEARRLLRAYWAWARTRPRFARDVVSNVTAEIDAHRGAIETLIFDAFNASDRSTGRNIIADATNERDAMLAAGDAMLAAEESLNKASYEYTRDGVTVRLSDNFVNHLYRHPTTGAVARAIVGRNYETGAITISLEAPVAGVSCREIAQSLWGPAAGGHDGIAGSPRGQSMDLSEVARAVDAVLAAFAASGHLTPLQAALRMLEAASVDDVIYPTGGVSPRDAIAALRRLVQTGSWT